MQLDTVSKILSESVRQHGDRIALRFCQSSECPIPDPLADAYDYRRLGAAALAYSHHLAGRGLGVGDKIALLCENRPEWVVAYFAIHQLGAALVPIDGLLTAGEIGHILQRSGAKLLIASDHHVPLASQAAQTGQPPVARLESDLADLTVPDTVDPDDLLRPAIGPDDLAVLCFTSGTTGVSKGIMLTHGNVTSNATTSIEVLDFTPDNRMVSILPANHMFEQTVGLLMPMAAGASVYFPGSRNPRVLFEAMADAKPTLVLVVPALARLIQTKLQGHVDNLPWPKRLVARAARRLSRGARCLGLDMSKRLFRTVHDLFGGHMRFMIAGGAALESEVAEFFLDMGLPMLEGYGLTETAPVIATNTVGRHRVDSVGVPIPRVEARTAPVDGAIGDDIGELRVRGPNVMAGYYEDPAATADAFDDDGWFKTGDLARIDSDGYIYIAGRAKDVIVNEAGKNIYPGEIEAVLVGSPHIRNACVLGICQDAQSTNETIVALIVPDPEALAGLSQANPEALLHREIRHACHALARYKRPKLVGIWPDEQFPQTATLKIKKHQVRQRLADIDLRPL